MLAGPCSANRSGPPPRGTGRRVHGARSPSRRRSEATRAPGRTVLRSDERGLPTDTEAVQHTEYDFRKPRQIGSTTFDHAFTDLERDHAGLAHVELRDPDHG